MEDVIFREEDLGKAVLSGRYGRTLPLDFTEFVLIEINRRSNAKELRSAYYRNFDRLLVEPKSDARGRRFLYFSDLYEIACSLGYPSTGKLLEAFAATVPEVKEPDPDDPQNPDEAQKSQGKAENKEKTEEKADLKADAEASPDANSKEIFVPDYDENAMRNFKTDHFLYTHMEDSNNQARDKENLRVWWKENEAVQIVYRYLSTKPLEETRWCCDFLHLLGCSHWIKAADLTHSPSAKAWWCIDSKISAPTSCKEIRAADAKAEWLKSRASRNVKNARTPLKMNEIINVCNGYNISYRWIIASWADDVFYGFDPYAEGAFDIFTLLDADLQERIAEEIVKEGDGL